METKDILSSCLDSEEQEMQQMQKQAKSMKQRSMNKLTALKTTIQHLSNMDFLETQTAVGLCQTKGMQKSSENDCSKIWNDQSSDNESSTSGKESSSSQKVSSQSRNEASKSKNDTMLMLQISHLFMT
ncbi:hypothetical protein Tco_0016291 [Tanacetum coccineum]